MRYPAWMTSGGTVLDRPYADLLTGAKIPRPGAGFGAYDMTAHIIGSQWVFGRAGVAPGDQASSLSDAAV